MTTPTPTPAKRKKLTLGPGSLNLGEAGSALDLSCQVTDVAISAEGNSEDTEYTLCGDAEAGARTYAWTLAITAFQDIEADGIIDYTWKHAGTEVKFEFRPDVSSGSVVTGTVVIDPVQLGGTANTKNKSEAEWGIVGNPNFTPAGAGDTEGTEPGTEG
ncbi:hypothetical protein [Corynebacterium kalidii]